MAEVSTRKTKYMTTAKADIADATSAAYIFIHYIIIIVRRAFGIHHGLPEQPPVVRCIDDITM